MYKSFYNLKTKPFQISTDPKFLWIGEKHKEALAILKYGILDNKGFLLLTGDVGTGKTTLINRLINSLGKDISLATVFNPELKEMDFFKYIADAFNINTHFTTKGKFLTCFSSFLLDMHSNNKKVLLIIDEAQRMDHNLLESIRLLSNIEKQSTKLINIFFVGQNELNDILLEKRNRALRQRITLNYHIDPLNKNETAEYIKYRLKIAGTQNNFFSFQAISEIYSFSKGYPRLINIICDHALLSGYVQEKKTINVEIIKECAQELYIPTNAIIDETPANAVIGKTASAHIRNNIKLKKQYNTHIPKPSPKNPSFLILIFSLLIIAGGLFYLNWNNMISYYFNISKQSDPVTSNNVTNNPYNDYNTLHTENLTAEKQNNNKNQNNKKVPDSSSLSNQVKQTINSTNIKSTLSRYKDNKLLLFFDYKSVDLSYRVINVLNKLVSDMHENPDITITIKGHTDSIGYETYNIMLSEYRANIIKNYLIAKGIRPLRINKTIGLGKKNPLKSNTTKKGRRLNRRVEIELFPGGM